MGIDVNGSSTDLQLWHVELADGVRTMSVLDLADAFRAGVIQLTTRVKKTQDPRWVAFGSVAGALADGEPGPRSAHVRSTYPPISVERHRHHSSIPPMATDIAPPPSFPPPPPAVRVSYPSNSTERMPAAPPSSLGPEYRMRGAVFAAVLLCALVGGFLTAKATNARSFGHRAASKAVAAPPVAPPPAVASSLPEPSESVQPVPPPPPTGTIVPTAAGSADPSLDARKNKRKPFKKPAKP